MQIIRLREQSENALFLQAQRAEARFHIDVLQRYILAGKRFAGDRPDGGDAGEKLIESAGGDAQRVAGAARRIIVPAGGRAVDRGFFDIAAEFGRQGVYGGDGAVKVERLDRIRDGIDHLAGRVGVAECERGFSLSGGVGSGLAGIVAGGGHQNGFVGFGRRSGV